MLGFILPVNDKGDVSTWSFEGGSVQQLVSLGWSKDSFKIDDKVEVGFRPMKDGSRGGQLMSATLASGQKLCSNRGCGDGSGAVLAPFLGEWAEGLLGSLLRLTAVPFSRSARPVGSEWSGRNARA